MNTGTIDFETYYSVKRGGEKYSLTRMTIEEYLNDPRFQILGCSTKVAQNEAQFVSGPNLKDHLASIDFSTSALIAHNAIFDASILLWKFPQIQKPRLYICTMALSRLVDGVLGGTKHSLSACAERHHLGVKGDELFRTDNKRLEDFDEEAMQKLGAYCCNDTELTYKLYKVLLGELYGQS